MCLGVGVGLVVLLAGLDIILDFLDDAQVSGVELLVGEAVEQVGILRRLLDDLHAHQGVGVLELYGEVGECLVFVVPDAHRFAVLPKLFGDPVRDVRD